MRCLGSRTSNLTFLPAPGGALALPLVLCGPPTASPGREGCNPSSMQGVRNGVAGLSFCMAGGRPPDLQEVCEPPCWPTVVFEIAANSVMGNIKCPLSVFSRLSVVVPGGSVCSPDPRK